jgi:hypothetical protein
MRFLSFHKNILLLFCLVFIWSILSSTVFASMDPVEVKEINEKAPYHIVGEVTSDELFKDITEDKNHPVQIRKMTLRISKVEKAPDGLETNNVVEVFYHYIPAWDAENYVGGAHMDIAVKDIISIWLSEGDYGWEPVLSRNSIIHLTYSEDRMDHIPEPFFHKIIVGLGTIRNTNLDLLVLFSLGAILIWAFYRGLRKVT